jgi:hypothetical protein
MSRFDIRLPTATALAILAVTGFCVAGEPLVTDRPDFTESALVVDRGRVQLEMGATYDDGASVDAFSLGELLIRWGFADSLELRVLAPTYLWVDEPGDDTSGFLDMVLGMKCEINDGGGQGFLGSTAAAVIVSTTVPTGSSAVGSDDWQPAAVFAASWDLAPSVSLGTNLGYARPSDGDRRFDSLWASLALGAGFTDDTSAFVELYGFNREEDRGPSTLVFQTGIVHLLSNDLQLDARVARRLTDAGPDFLVGVGASWRC